MTPVLAIAAGVVPGKRRCLKADTRTLCQRHPPGLIKHTHHNMDVDKPGKDSYELRKAGAAQTMVASRERWALMTETPDEAPLDLAYLVSRMDHSTLDLVLVEGFKHEAVAKILLFRSDAGHDVSELTLDEHVIAVASDVALDVEVPVLDLNDEDKIAEFIVGWCAV